jgi:hypothetical protein
MVALTLFAIAWPISFAENLTALQGKGWRGEWETQNGQKTPGWDFRIRTMIHETRLARTYSLAV